MLISETHQFIFLAVAKTGSSSIEAALAPYRSALTDQFKKHATCTRVKRELPAAMWQQFFKFAIVRNPYDCMQSWYFYRQREELADPGHPRHHLFTGNQSFDEFVETFGQKEWMLNQVEWVAPAAMDLKVQLDYVGRYETLDEDYREICHRIGIPHTPLPTLRSSSNSREKTAKLWTPYTRQLVNEYFRQDFETFGFEMLTA